MAGLVLSGCATATPEVAPETFARVQVFCYRSLAEVECHPAPLRGEETRFSGTAWSGPFRLPVVHPAPAPREEPS